MLRHVAVVVMVMMLFMGSSRAMASVKEGNQYAFLVNSRMYHESYSEVHTDETDSQQLTISVQEISSNDQQEYTYVVNAIGDGREFIFQTPSIFDFEPPVTVGKVAEWVVLEGDQYSPASESERPEYSYFSNWEKNTLVSMQGVISEGKVISNDGQFNTTANSFKKVATIDRNYFTYEYNLDLSFADEGINFPYWINISESLTYHLKTVINLQTLVVESFRLSMDHIRTQIDPGTNTSMGFTYYKDVNLQFIPPEESDAIILIYIVIIGVTVLYNFRREIIGMLK